MYPASSGGGALFSLKFHFQLYKMSCFRLQLLLLELKNTAFANLVHFFVESCLVLHSDSESAGLGTLSAGRGT